jgi:hypothetical protein
MWVDSYGRSSLQDATNVIVRMNFGSRESSNTESHGEVARLALLPGTDKPDLVQGAVKALLGAAEVDRAGAWMDEGEFDSGSPRGLPIFRGLVSERGGEDTPSEWGRLSLEALPWLDLLSNQRAVHQELDGTSEQLMLVCAVCF